MPFVDQVTFGTVLGKQDNITAIATGKFPNNLKGMVYSRVNLFKGEVDEFC
jgi:hypothetical protein